MLGGIPLGRGGQFHCRVWIFRPQAQSHVCTVFCVRPTGQKYPSLWIFFERVRLLFLRAERLLMAPFRRHSSRGIAESAPPNTLAIRVRSMARSSTGKVPREGRRGVVKRSASATLCGHQLWRRSSDPLDIVVELFRYVAIRVGYVGYVGAEEPTRCPPGRPADGRVRLSPSRRCYGG